MNLLPILLLISSSDASTRTDIMCMYFVLCYLHFEWNFCVRISYGDNRGMGIFRIELLAKIHSGKQTKTLSEDQLLYVIYVIVLSL